MKYSLTDKLNFDDNPVIDIKGKLINVNSDAETVLKLMDLIESKGEMETSKEAPNLLFSEKDLKTIKDLKLQFNDYMTVISTAIALAIGEDPDADTKNQGEA